MQSSYWKSHKDGQDVNIRYQDSFVIGLKCNFKMQKSDKINKVKFKQEIDAFVNYKILYQYRCMSKDVTK